MSSFYGLPDASLLSLPIDRFWGKYRNMSIMRLRRKIEEIGGVRLAGAKMDDYSHEMYKLNWQLEQLTGEEKVDGLGDIRKKMDAVRKAAKKKGKKK